MNADVGRAAFENGLICCPGVFTACEAISADALGASVLKFFPAELMPPAAIGALRAVLPEDAVMAAVGGITPRTLAAYDAVGTGGFGLGYALFRPDYGLADVAKRAQDFMETFNKLEKEQ